MFRGWYSVPGYLVFHTSAFWLEIAYFGLNFDDFGWKIGKNVKINYSDPQKVSLTQNTSTNKRRLVSIHQPARLVGEPKKTRKGRKEGRKKERHPKQWQTGYSPRPTTSSDQKQTLHGGWPAVYSYACQVSSKSVNGLRRCGLGVKNGSSPITLDCGYSFTHFILGL